MTDAATLTTRTSLGSRFDDWILERVRQKHGVPPLPFTLKYRNIYVMPTRFGFWFGVLLALTALGGLNFNNNMALAVGFLLVAIAQLTTLLAYRNLAGLTVVSLRAPPVFAGDAAQFHVVVENPEPRFRFAIQGLLEDDMDCADIRPRESAVLCLEQYAERRGWLEMQPFRLENRYPIGLFRAWSVIVPQARCLVYPQPAANPPPLPQAGRGDEGATRQGEGEHLHGLREYSPGDPLKTIAWKTSARHEKLYSRVMESPGDDACEFNWYLMRGDSTEEKLSIMAAWILKAEDKQIPYSLEMPTDALPTGLGKEHRDACLEILALFKS
jgi:uncharacterized protein (DUF58 family)